MFSVTKTGPTQKNVGDSAEFVEWVRHNVVLPADAAPWRAVVRGELPPLGQDEQRVIAAAGPAFFTAAALNDDVASRRAR